MKRPFKRTHAPATSHEAFSQLLPDDPVAAALAESMVRPGFEHCINEMRQEMDFSPSQKLPSNHWCLTAMNKMMHKETRNPSLKIPLPFQPQRLRRSEHGSRSGAGAKGSSSEDSQEKLKIREFWLGLEEGKRKSLVLQEKAVLLKLWKEKQRLSCTCKYCEHKKSLVEEEIEILYETYYQVLDEYTKFLIESKKNGKKIPADEFPEFGRLLKPIKNAKRVLNFGADIRPGKENFVDFFVKVQAKKVLEIIEQILERKIYRDLGESNPHRQVASENDRKNDKNSGENDDSFSDDEYLDDDAEESYEDDDFCDDDCYDHGHFLHDEQSVACDACERSGHDDEQLEEIFHLIASMTFEQRVTTAYYEHVALEKRRKLIEEEEERLQRQQQQQAEAKSTKQKGKKEKKKSPAKNMEKPTKSAPQVNKENNGLQETNSLNPNDQLVTNIPEDNQDEESSTNNDPDDSSWSTQPEIFEQNVDELEPDENVSRENDDSLQASAKQIFNDAFTEQLQPVNENNSDLVGSEPNSCSYQVDFRNAETAIKKKNVHSFIEDDSAYSAESFQSTSEQSQPLALDELEIVDHDKANLQAHLTAIVSPSSLVEPDYHTAPAPGLTRDQVILGHKDNSVSHKNAIPISAIEDELFKNSGSYQSSPPIGYPNCQILHHSNLHYNYPPALNHPYPYQGPLFNGYFNPSLAPTFHQTSPPPYAHIDHLNQSNQFFSKDSKALGILPIEPKFSSNQSILGSFSNNPQSSGTVASQGELQQKRYNLPIGIEIGTANNRMWNPLCSSNPWKFDNAKGEFNNSVENRTNDGLTFCPSQETKSDLFIKSMLLYQKAL